MEPCELDSDETSEVEGAADELGDSDDERCSTELEDDDSCTAALLPAEGDAFELCEVFSELAAVDSDVDSDADSDVLCEVEEAEGG